MPGILLAGDVIDVEDGSSGLPEGCNTFIWHGWDGSTWNLSDGSSGVVLQSGVRGLTDPEFNYYEDELVGIDGSVDRGWRVPSREVFWPLTVALAGVTGQSWLDLDRAFWRTLQPGRYGEWEVQQPGGESRRIRLRLADDGAQRFDTDPALIGRATYGITLRAPDPYWFGPDINGGPFGTTAGVDFFGADDGDGLALPFGISSSSTLATASVINPGDVEAWPVWTVYGPFASASLGVGSSTIAVPFSLAAGKALVVNTNPVSETAFEADVATDGVTVTLTSVERTGDLGPAIGFAPIPPGNPVPLTVALSGTGKIGVSFRPRFLRAW